MAAQDMDLSKSRATEVIVVAWVFTGIAIASVAVKLFARVQIVKVVGWDDFFIFFSLALSIIASALVTYSAYLGLGRHTAAVLAEYGEARLVLTAKWQILGYPFNIGSFSFPNISIAILITRLLDPDMVRTRCIYSIVGLQVISAIVSILIVFFLCSPTEKLWNPTVPGRCLNPNVLNYFSYWLSAYTTVTDFVLAIIPISVFWRLRMRFSAKLGVCIMMGLTMLSAIVTIIKATYLHLFTEHTDPLYDVVPLVLWGLVEQNVVIVAACVPTMRPFFHKAFGSNKSTESHSGSGFKLSSSSKPSRTIKRLASVSELPLDEREQHNDIESNCSQRGIWRTVDISVESDEESMQARQDKK